MHPSELTLNGFAHETLTAAEQSDVARHLSSCDTCRALVDDLREIRRAAADLSPVDPPAAAWSRIEEAIRREAPVGDGRTAARTALTFPSRRQLGWLAIAATIVLAAYIGLRLRPLAPASVPGADAANTNSAESVESEMRQAEEHYDKAIKGLEQIAKEGESQLDATTAATLQKNLAVVDQAIDESRAAVRSEPTSEPARDSLMDSFTTKIALLQDTVSLINEMRKGNDAGAAQIVSGLK